MPRKHTTYTRPSIIAQIEDGRGSSVEVRNLIVRLEKEGASNKTLKRLRKLDAERFGNTFNSAPVAAWARVNINSFHTLPQHNKTT